MAMKRKSLVGTGLNGKGQGANAVLGGLRAQAIVTEEPAITPTEPNITEPLATLSETPSAPAAEPKTVQPVKAPPSFAAAEDAAPTVPQVTPGTPSAAAFRSASAVMVSAIPRAQRASQTAAGTRPAPGSRAVKAEPAPKKRKTCSFQLELDLITELATLQAQYALVGQEIEKSEIVNAALRAYLPRLKAELAPRVRKLLSET